MIQKLLYKTNIKGLATSDLFKKASLAFLIKVLNAGLAFVYSFFLASLIGAEGTGIYYFSITISYIIMLVCSMGFNNVLLKYVSIYAAENDWAKIKALCKKTFIISGVLALSSALILYFSADYIATYLLEKTTLIFPLKIIAWAIIPMVFIYLLQEILKALGQYKASLIVGGLILPSLGIPMVLWLTNIYAIEGALLSFLICNTCALVVGAYLFYRSFPNKKVIATSFDTRLLMKTSIPLLIIVLTTYLISNGDIVLLGIWVENTDIGVYAIAKKIGMLTSFVLVAVNTIIAPKFAALYQQNKLEELKEIVQQASLLLLIFATPFLLFICLFSKSLLGIIDEEFVRGAWILIVLSFGQFINVVTGSVGYLLMMCGYERMITIYYLISLAIGIILYWLVIPLYGIMGAAYVTAFIIVLQNLLSVYLVKQKMGFFIFKMPFNIGK